VGKLCDRALRPDLAVFNTKDMTLATELARLYQRDLTRLGQEIEALPGDESLWQTTAGMTNSPGNLALHLEGNLREFVGRILGGVDYTRQRDLEFSTTGLTKDDVLSRVEVLKRLIPGAIEALSDEALGQEYPLVLFGAPMSSREMLLHLLGHLNYHLGQIDAQRRAIAAQGAITLAGLAK
jgi:uncharacterized damage-inducible protein DinB